VTRVYAEYITTTHQHKTMNVRKRNGSIQTFDLAKITAFIHRLVEKHTPLTYIDVSELAGAVQDALGESADAARLPIIVSQVSAARTTRHHDYSLLAGRAITAKIQQETPETFSAAMGRLSGVLDPSFSALCASGAYDDAIKHDRDFQYDVFGISTLRRSYLLKHDGDVVERPQYMLMRVAVYLWGNDMNRVLETYELMSTLQYTHATPTLFNAGMKHAQLASCFLATMQDDSIQGIFKTLSDCASISKSAGGIGLSVSQIRAKGSFIRGTNGTSNGLTPMLRVFNNCARYCDQGGGRRKGSFAIWLEPHHPDVFDFLDLKKNHGVEEERARDLFYGLWMSDLFMKRVETDGDWSTFCPDECPGLQDAWGDDYERLYHEYESLGKARDTFKARKLWFAILDSQMETGTPYLCYKDAVNSKSNQQNLGTIRSSNLCCEVTEFTSPEETAVCTLASIALPSCVKNGSFDFDHLERVVTIATRNLDRVIDVNDYPVVEAKVSNERHRPLGLGVQGLADVFQMLCLPYDSEGAAALNRDIFETIYYAAVCESIRMAAEKNPYTTYEGSPASQGKLQFDLWGVTPSKHDWDTVKEHLESFGMRNALLVAPMPTASTAQILGNTESFEPRTSNLYVRRTLSGEFMVINKHLQNVLSARGLWSDALAQALIASRGSVQTLDVPDDIKAVYKTVWELSQKSLIDLSAGRGPYVCQSQSLNLYLAQPTRQKLTAMHFYAWKQGLKTGSYYIRQKPAATAMQFTVDATECLSCSA